MDLTITRNGRTQHVRVKTINVQGHAVIGVLVRESFRFPFPITIKVGNIGGPSAGLMFALGIVDKLTPGSLTGGKFVAGTGRSPPAGRSRRSAGSSRRWPAPGPQAPRWFLTPAANCADASGAVPAGLHLAKVSTLRQALSDLSAIRAGRSVPGC